MSDDTVRLALRIAVFMSAAIFGCIGLLALIEGEYVGAAVVLPLTIVSAVAFLRAGRFV